MKVMTIKEIKVMVGLEFKYSLSNGNELPAVVAAFDEKIGFTVLATSLDDSSGFCHDKYTDKNGNLCLIGIGREQFDTESAFMKQVSSMAKVIKLLGYYSYGAEHEFGRPARLASARCSF